MRKRKDQKPYRVEYFPEYAVIYFKCQGDEFASLVDLEDVGMILSFPNTFYAHRETNGKYYVQSYLPKTNGRKKGVKLHRMIMREPDKQLDVDHINHNTLDNRKSNLRVVSRTINLQNAIKTKAISGAIGVRWIKKTGKWVVRHKIDGKIRNFGTFDNLEEAKRVSLDVRKRLMPHTYEAFLARESG